MTINCKEFSYLIDRKKIFSDHDIPSLIAYNNCLANEVSELNSKADGLDKENQAINGKIDRLEEQLIASKEMQ
ncbi:hypothetical protein, partial [Shewanella colwelliana]|uniref:hypothetical protein n=1 Tax=Shewanella colwelliana TaxID=23 RepID=UPI001C7D58CB